MRLRRQKQNEGMDIANGRNHVVFEYKSAVISSVRKSKRLIRGPQDSCGVSDSYGEVSNFVYHKHESTHYCNNVSSATMKKKRA